MRNRYVFSAATAALIAAFSCSVHAQQGVIRISAPAKGQVVRPGDTINISVLADSSVQKLALVGQQPIGMARLSSGAAGAVAQGQGQDKPIDFQVAIPLTAQPGIYRLTAVGKSGSDSVASEKLDLDVERPSEPLRIWAEPAILQFTHIGDRLPLRVLGSFADGSQSELTRSTKTSFVSEDASVASIAEDGTVTAVGNGKTSILVRTPSRDYSIPVRVEPAQ